MCCFSPVTASMSWLGRLFGAGRVHVSDTSIFARLESPDTQLLVYSMTLSVRTEVAMILPVPTPPSASEDALSFIDLHAHPRMFTELAQLFDLPAPQAKSSATPLRFAPPSYLKVHQVGSFVASFAPRRSDLARLEPRFRLPDAVWDSVPAARDFGFAVFQLVAGDHQIHPMAFRFHTRDASRLFFPTIHIHDGRVHAHASFDHALYYQHPRVAQPPTGPVLPAFVDGAQVAFMSPRSDYAGVVNPAQPLLRRTLRGRLPNRDTYIDLA